MLIKRITPILLILALSVMGCTAQDTIHMTIDNPTGIISPSFVVGDAPVDNTTIIGWAIITLSNNTTGFVAVYK